MNFAANSRATSSLIAFSLLNGRPPKVLFDGFYLGVDTQTVLSQSPGYTWHVRGFPCEDVSVLTEELDERFFLFAVECC